MLFKRMDYCEINRQREPAQVFNNYCESGPARGHCSCVASVAPVEYLSSSLPPLSSPPLLQSVHYQCLLPRVRATAGRRGGRATGGRPRPAPHRRLLVLLAPKYLGAAVRVRDWDWRRRRGDSTDTGCGWRGRARHTSNIFRCIIYYIIISLQQLETTFAVHSSFGITVLLFYYCRNVKTNFLYSMMFSLWVDLND